MINKKCIFVHVYVHKKGDSQREKCNQRASEVSPQ